MLEVSKSIAPSGAEDRQSTLRGCATSRAFLTSAAASPALHRTILPWTGGFLFYRGQATLFKVDIYVPTIAQRDDKIATFLKLFSTDWASKKSSMRD
jgi:hypothetical protein